LNGVKLSHRSTGREPDPEILKAQIRSGSMKFFHRCLGWSWIFHLYPVLLTTLALPLLIFCTRGKERWFYLGIAAVWYFNMVLLSTVGRPLERYLMPLVPLMFWVLSGVILPAWTKLLRLAGGSTSLAASSSQNLYERH
jgi:hypothetical protein